MRRDPHRARSSSCRLHGRPLRTASAPWRRRTAPASRRRSGSARRRGLSRKNPTPGSHQPHQDHSIGDWRARPTSQLPLSGDTHVGSYRDLLVRWASRCSAAIKAPAAPRVCRPVATPETVGARYRRWRLVAVDGTVFDVPDTAMQSRTQVAGTRCLPAAVRSWTRPASAGEVQTRVPSGAVVTCRFTPWRWCLPE